MVNDHWNWDGDDPGAYTVRSGYAWLRDKHQMMLDNQDWRWLWKLSVPEKVRCFVWMALHDALPVNRLRHKCHMAPSGACSRCSSQEEDALHALRDCPHSREIWTRLGAWRWYGFQNQNLATWIQELATGNHGRRFLAELWGAWKWRCNMCFDPHPWTIEVAWRNICHEHDAFCQFLKPGISDSDFAWMRTRWTPPSAGLLKLNVDGSFDVDDGHIGGGGLIRDHTSSWVCGFMSHAASGNAFTAEASALRDGLLMAWSHGARNLVCESDCKELIDLLQRRDRHSFHIQAALLQEICNLLDKGWRVELIWIPREVNSVADWMAKQGLRDRNINLQQLHVPSQELQVMLLQDSLGAP